LILDFFQLLNKYFQCEDLVVNHIVTFTFPKLPAYKKAKPLNAALLFYFKFLIYNYHEFFFFLNVLSFACAKERTKPAYRQAGKSTPAMIYGHCRTP